MDKLKYFSAEPFCYPKEPKSEMKKNINLKENFHLIS